MISRRDFLKFASLFGLSTAAAAKILYDKYTIPNSGQNANLLVDFRLWYIRPDDLLDLEFGFINLERIGTDNMGVRIKDKAKKEAFMVVRLPQMDVAEELLDDDVNIDENTIVKSYLSGFSYLVFRFKNLNNFKLTGENLLDWQSSNFFELVTLNNVSSKDDIVYQNTNVNYDKTEQNPGIAVWNKTTLVTTFEISYGLSLSPLSEDPNEYKGVFSMNNRITPINTYYFPNSRARSEQDVEKNYKKSLPTIGKNLQDVNSTSDQNKIEDYHKRYKVLWHNNLYFTASNGKKVKPVFKVVGFNEDVHDNLNLLPTKNDKQTLYRQFRSNEDSQIQGAQVKDKHDNKQKIDEQKIEVESDSFQITAKGLLASLVYVSPDEQALLQKLIKEVRLGRDQYIEVQRLGYMYPLGIRVVEVEIGQRKIRNGASYIERKKYISPLEKVIVYRTAEDQDVTQLKDSVLQRVVEHPDKNDANYVRSCKRSFPFQQLEVLTNEFIEIKNFEAEIKEAIKIKVDKIYNNTDEQVKDFLNKTKVLIIYVYEKQNKIREKAELERGVGSNLFELAQIFEQAVRVKSSEDFVKDEFATLIGVYQKLKVQVSELITSEDIDLEELKEKATQLHETLIKIPDVTINTLQEELRKACENAKEQLNNNDNQLNYIASVTSEGINRISAFWPKMINAAEVKFDFMATDWDGKKVKFAAPFIFVTGEVVRKVDEFNYKKKRIEGDLDKLKDSFGNAINKEVMYLQQHLLEYKKEIDIYLSKPQQEIDEIKRRIDETAKDLLIQVYNRSEELLSTLVEEEKKVRIREIIELRKEIVTEYETKRDRIEQEINKWEDNKKVQHLLYTVCVLYPVEKILSSEYNNIRTKLQTFASDAESKVKAWMPHGIEELSKEWYEVNNRLHKLDQDVARNYHHIKNETRRKIGIANEKIAYYKSKLENVGDAAKQEVEEKIHELETVVLEFAAVPIAQVAELRSKAEKTFSGVEEKYKQEYQRMKDFSQQFTFTYPQLLAAQVKLPVVKELMGDVQGASQKAEEAINKGKAIIIGYADAYRMAGIEEWQKVNDEKEELKRNAEQILFEVQQPFEEAAKVLSDAKGAFEKLRKDVGTLAENYEKDITSAWQRVNDQVQDFETSTVGYAKGKVENIFAEAQEKVGGLVNPGVVIEKISAIKGMAYTLGNEVNHYSGEIKSFSTDAENYVKDASSDIKTFEKKAKDFAIDKKDKIENLLNDIKIFGLSIKDLLANANTFSPKELPEAKITIIKEGLKPVSSEVSYCWSPPKDKQLFKDGTGLIKFINGSDNSGARGGDNQSRLTGNQNARIDLCLTNFSSFDSARENRLISSISLTNFGIGAAEVIKIYFERISFLKQVSSRLVNEDWKTSTDTSINIKILKVEFTGFLELIKQLQESLGLGDGFLMQANTEGITVSYGIRVPAISTGAFTLSNINLYAGLVLKFRNDPPAVRFAFGERANPFTLAVGIFGGRGFFAINVSSRGVEQLEGSLEFGAYIALDIAGIARGQAYLMGGIYFRKRSGESVYVEAYIVCGGSLSIIGLIQVSIVFYLGMSYQNGALRGFASVEVSVKILFFSASYTLSFEKKITGNDGITSARPTNPYWEAKNWYAWNDKDHNTFVDDQASYIPESENRIMPPYRCLFIEEKKNEWDEQISTKKKIDANRLIPVHDPTVLYEHEMIFNTYVKQFGN